VAAPLVVVIHGPNLAALGWREPAVYGSLTLADVDARIREAAGALGLEAKIVQSNHEGTIVDSILDARMAVGVVVNAAAYAHSSLAIADAIRAIHPVPVVEVHLSNTVARGRVQAPVGEACLGRIEGFGAHGYVLALEAIDRMRQGP
jgi:3-dehydroquinate dehydratase-2